MDTPLFVQKTITQFTYNQLINFFMKKVLQTCLLLIIAAVCAFTPPLRAQETITIGTGTSTTYYTPYNSLYNYSFVQQIYTADEIGMPGTITAIAFNSSDQSDNCNFDIYMKLVSRSSFSSDTDFEPITSADLVYSGTYTITTGWNNFELDAPFAYDGSSNLLIAFHEKTGAYSSKHFYYTSAANMVVCAYSDSYNPTAVGFNPASYSGSKAKKSERANIQISIVEGEVSCARPTGLTVGNVTTNTVDLSWTNGDAETAWELEYNGNTEVITSNPYTLTGLNAATDYAVRVRAICSENDSSLWSSFVSFRTECDVVVVDDNNSFFESFEGSDLGCWTSEIISGTYDWSISTSYHQSGSSSAFFTWSGLQARLISPVMDLTNISTEPRLRFYHRQAIWSGGVDAMGVYYRTAPDEAWTLLADYTTEYANLTLEEMILPNPSATYQIAFISNADDNYGIYVDDITVDKAPTCIRPNNLVASNVTPRTVDLAWNAQNGETEWEVEFNGETVIANENPYVLDVLAPETNYSVRVRAICTASDSSEWSNPVSFTTLISCPRPTGLTVSNITSTSATFAWTNGGEEGSWMISVNDQIYEADANPFTINDLTPATIYSAKVRAICGIGDSSQWSTTTNFVTECVTFMVTESNPYVEGFEINTFPPTCWSRNHTAGTSTNQWTRTTTSSYVHSGSGAAQLQDQQTGNRNDLVTGLLNIPETDAYMVDFWMLRSTYSTLKPNEGIKVWVNTTPDTVGGTEIAYIHREYTLAPAEEATGWYQYSANIPTSGDIYVIFQGISEYGTSSYIDDIAVKAIPACARPLNVAAANVTATSAEISWTAQSDEEAWEIELNGDTVLATSNPFTVAINPATLYHARVRAFCGEDEYSDWSTSCSFATPCVAFTITATEPFTEDFSGYTASSYSSTGVMPLCWDAIAASTYGPHVSTSYAPNSSSNNALVLTSGTNSSYGSPNYAVLPEFTNDLSHYTLTFRSKMESTSYNHLTVGYMTDLDVSTYNVIETITNTTNAADHEVVLPVIPAGSRLAFRSVETTGTYYCASIDDVTITVAASCVKPSALTVTNITGHSAVLDWTSVDETSWVISINGVDSIITEKPYTLTNLSPVTPYTIALRAICSETDSSVWSNNVTFTTTVSCPAPSALTFSNLTENSAEISWTNGGDESAWEIECDSITEVVTSNPYTLTGLTAETSYNVRVRAICAEEDSSAWSSTLAIYTGMCIPAPTSVDNSGITNVAFGNYDLVNNNTHPHAAPYYGDYMDQVGSMSAGESTTVNISFATSYTYGTVIWVNWNNDLSLTDDEVVYTGTSLSANPTTLSCTITVPANTPNGEYRMRIGAADSHHDNAITNGQGFDPCYSGSYTIYEDYTLRIQDVPTCLPVTNITFGNVMENSAEISWTAQNGETSWEIEYDGNTEVVTSNPYTITGLQASTEYAVRVRAICSATDTSNWSPMSSFHTLCGDITITHADPYFEDFASYNVSSSVSTMSDQPDCWEFIYTGTNANYAPHVYNGTYAPNGNNALVLVSGASSYGQTNYAIMPTFTNNLNTLVASFKTKMESASSGTLVMGYITDINDGNTFTALETIAGSTSAATHTYELSGYTIPANARLAFRWDVVASYTYFSASIDDIELTLGCETPENVAVDENYTITWDAAEAESWSVRYVVNGDTTTVHAANPIYVITGLNEGDEVAVMVQANCSATSTSPWSEAVTFTYQTQGGEDTTGINNYALQASVFPNPTNGIINIECSSINAEVAVYDMFGRIVMTDKITAIHTELDFSTFAPGVYTIRIADATKATNIKVVKE